MKLLENIGCEKGITLNSQLVDLLSIIDNKNLTEEQQNDAIVNYINNLKVIQEKYEKANSNGVYAKYKFFIQNAISSMNGLSDENRERLEKIYLSNAKDLIVCNRDKMIQILQKEGFDESIHTKIMSDLKSKDYNAKEGILYLTPEKVRTLYSHMFENGNRYDRVTFDNAGKYSGYVAPDGETYSTEKIEKMQKFCENHGMKSKINALMFYDDFPKTYEKSLDIRVNNGEITEEDKRNLIQKSLFDYVRNIGQQYGNRIESVDIFNEFIYDPNMKEEGFDEPTDEYQYRTQGWHKYLDLEDMCKMALIARKEMPNVVFTYNDMNWINPDKRKQIIDIIKQIKAIEEKFRIEGTEIDGQHVKLEEGETLIDIIGFEAHLTTGDNVEDIEAAFLEVEQQIGLPIGITELDVARVGDDPLSKTEITKQNRIIEKIVQLAQEGRVRELTVWSQSDEMSFMNDKCNKMVYASAILDKDCNEKEYEISKDIELQNFNYHTHTSLCGHAYGEMEEYIKKAIEGGITDLGFSDHMPNPFGKENPKQSMNIAQFHSEYIPMLEKLREKYKDLINIKIGLECEYYGEQGEQFPQLKEFRNETEGKLDYMILGQHFALKRDEQGQLVMPPQMASKTSSQYPLDYAMTLIEAMQSGKFAYIAHPDIFMEGRDGVPDEEKALYIENSIKATQMICEMASKNNIPLEVNLGSISAIEAGIKDKMIDGSYTYPVPEFWKIAQEYGCKVLIGIDAHTPEALKEKKYEIIAKRLIEDNGIELDYLESYEPGKISRSMKKNISALDSAEEAINENIRTGKVNEQVQAMQAKQQERMNPDTEKENNNKSLD